MSDFHNPNIQTDYDLFCYIGHRLDPDYFSPDGSIQQMTLHCPAHHDKNPSLAFNVKNGKALIDCKAGCSTEAILEARGLKMSDLFLDGCSRSHTGGSPHPMPVNKEQQPTFKRELLEAAIKDIPEISDEFFIERSPVNPLTMTTTDYLLSAYRRGDVLFISNKKKAGYPNFWAEIANPENWKERLEQLAKAENPEGVIYLPNSVTGQPIIKEKGKQSWRSKENVNRFEYFVFEADVLTKLEQRKLLAVLPLPIVAIFFSGGKSYHALIRVNLENPTREDWQKWVERLKKPLVELGADISMFQIQQPCRLPQCHRGSELQRLIYFNPEPILEGSLWTHGKK